MSSNEGVISPAKLTEGESQLGRTVLRLREMILKGEFGPGERISEHPLAARLGVSRTPIRLALERLAHEGLLEPYPTGGFIVRSFTLQDIWDGIEVRGLLEGGVARLAAERLTSDRDVDRLRKIQQDMDAIGEPTTETFLAYLDINDTFHSEIVPALEKRYVAASAGPAFLVPYRVTSRSGFRPAEDDRSIGSLRHQPRASL